MAAAALEASPTSYGPSVLMSVWTVYRTTTAPVSMGELHGVVCRILPIDMGGL